MPQFVVRYGSLRHLGVFSSRSDDYRRGMQVIVRTKRGLELGDLLCEATERAVQNLTDSTGGQVQRELNENDQKELARIRAREREIWEFTRKTIENLKLEMKLVDVEHVFGGERILIYYLAENRIDFRELVKVLAAEFQTRIEMRQIGVRDEIGHIVHRQEGAAAHQPLSPCPKLPSLRNRSVRRIALGARIISA